MATSFLPGVDPIGGQVRLPWGTYRIIGIVGNIKVATLERLSRATIYFNADQMPSTDMTLLVRSGLSQNTVVVSAQQIVSSLDKDQPVYDVYPLEARVDRTLRTRRFVGSLIVTFAASGTILAAVGLYGLLSYSIAFRRREIGIRVALGAHPAAIAGLVYRGGLSIVAAGLALGCAGSIVARRFLASLLYGTPFDDAATWLAVLAVLGLTSFLACALPARRATMLNPLESLRAE